MSENAEDGDDLFAAFAAVPSTLPVRDDVPTTKATTSTLTQQQQQEERQRIAPGLSISSVPLAPPSSKHGMLLLGAGSSVAPAASTTKPATAAFIVEKHANIAITRPTEGVEQIPTVMAQYPYASFETFLSSSSSLGGSKGRECTVIGVVVRKSEPKVGEFGVITLWDMNGFCDLSPSSSSSAGNKSNMLPLLVSGAAFTELYIRLSVGDVVMAARPEILPPRAASSSSGGGGGTSGGVLAKVSDYHQVRILGYAKSLGHCGAALHNSSSGSTNSGDVCQQLVNKDGVNRCKFHAGSLRREALGATSTQKQHQYQPLKSQVKQPIAVTTTTTTSSSMPFLSTAKSQLGGQSSCAGAMRTASSAGTSQFIAVRRGAVVSANGKDPSSDTAAARKPTMEYSGVTRAKGSLPETGFNEKAETSFPSPASLGTTAMGHRALRAVIEESHQLEVEGERRAAMTTSAVPPGPATMMMTMKKPPGPPRAAGGPLSAGSKGSMPTAKDEITTSRMNNASGDARDDEEQRVGFKRCRSPPFVSGAKAPSTGADPSSLWDAEAKRLRAEAARAAPTFAPLTGRGDPRLADVAVTSKLATMGSKVGISSNGFANKFATSLSPALTVKNATSSLSAPSGGSRRSFTVLGRVADALSSRHDDARLEAMEAASRSLDAKALAQDAAYRALDSITEEPAKGYYCSVCKQWGFSKQKKCQDAGHAGFAGDTVKAYFSCKECGTKAPVLGAGHGALLPMFCPRCRSNTVFERSTAAPNIPDPYKPRLP